MKKACFAGSTVGNSKSYLVQPSIFVSQQYYGVANFSCCCDSSDSRSPGESGRGLKSNGAGDGAGCVFTSTWVLIQRVLHNPKNITYIHHQIYLSHTVHDYSRWKVIRDGKCQEFNSFPLLLHFKFKLQPHSLGKMWYFGTLESIVVQQWRMKTVSTVLVRCSVCISGRM